MPELAKIEPSQTQSRRGSGPRDQIAIAIILILLATVQALYAAKHRVTFEAILSQAAFGIIAP
jgi:hypothetical protein